MYKFNIDRVNYTYDKVNYNYKNADKFANMLINGTFDKVEDEKTLK